jgi:hypothetical protein
MSVMISALKRCSVRIYLQLFVEGLMSYLRYLCLRKRIVITRRLSTDEWDIDTSGRIVNHLLNKHFTHQPKCSLSLQHAPMQ